MLKLIVMNLRSYIQNLAIILGLHCDITLVSDPNIVRIQGCVGSGVQVVAEQQVRQHGPFPTVVLLDILCDILGAIESSHDTAYDIGEVRAYSSPFCTLFGCDVGGLSLVRAIVEGKVQGEWLEGTGSVPEGPSLIKTPVIEVCRDIRDFRDVEVSGYENVPSPGLDLLEPCFDVPRLSLVVAIEEDRGIVDGLMV